MPELSVALPSARRDAVQLCAALPPAMHFASRAGTAPSAGSAALLASARSRSAASSAAVMLASC